MSAVIFCPEYRDNDIFKGSYYSDKYSWLRLAVHRCDPTDLIEKNGELVNKTCASHEEQNNFFEQNILSLMINKQDPALHSPVDAVRKINSDTHYSVKANKLTEYNDFWIERNNI